MIRTIFRTIFYNTVLLDVFQRLNMQYCGILMFHRVAKPDPDGIVCNQHLKVSPEFFSHFIETSLRQGYTFISMDEIVEILQKKKRLKKVLCITFDDGYRDNLTTALPILESWNVPAVIYCTTGFLTGDFIPWWDFIEYCINRSRQLKIHDTEKFSCCSYEDKKNVFLTLRKYFLQFTEDKLQKEIAAFANENNIAMKDWNSCELMTLDDFIQYKQHPLLTWGCHTHSHLSAAHISSSIFQNDLFKSLQFFSNAGYTPRHFAFPFGDDLTIQRDIERILQNAGFCSAVSTEAGLISYGDHCNTMFLPRLFISQFDKRVNADYIIAAELLHQKLSQLCQR